MAGRAKENLPGGSLKYLFVYLKIRIFKRSYRSYTMAIPSPRHTVHGIYPSSINGLRTTYPLDPAPPGNVKPGQIKPLNRPSISQWDLMGFQFNVILPLFGDDPFHESTEFVILPGRHQPNLSKSIFLFDENQGFLCFLVFLAY
jgi:hypothetical protein